MGRQLKTNDPQKRRGPPALTADAREKQLIELAVDLASRQILEGNVSAQVLTHFLKLGTIRERLEEEKLRYESDLLKAKAKALASIETSEELYASALKAMSKYSGNEPSGD